MTSVASPRAKHDLWDRVTCEECEGEGQNECEAPCWCGNMGMSYECARCGNTGRVPADPETCVPCDGAGRVLLCPRCEQHLTLDEADAHTGAECEGWRTK